MSTGTDVDQRYSFPLSEIRDMGTDTDAANT